MDSYSQALLASLGSLTSSFFYIFIFCLYGKNDNKANETNKIFDCSCWKHFHISQTLNKKRLSHDRSTNWQLNYLTNICHNFSVRHGWKSECEFAERVRFPSNSRDANID